VALALALALAGIVLVAPLPFGRPRRLTRLARLRAAEPTPSRRDSPLLLGVVAGLAVTVLIGRWWGVPAGIGVGVAVTRGLRRRPPPAVLKARRQATADLPLGADLLAAALRAGAPVDRAAAAVADALGGPLGERLARTARSLRLGAGPAEAWAHLSDVPGAGRLVAAAVRSSASGGALAGALGRLADDLRSDRRVAAEAAARRAGVLIVLPLGLCFLPAFLLAGLVPVIVAVLGDVL
jgi:pilus assembly protein TadC